MSIARCKTVLGTEDGHTVHTEPSPKHTEAAEGQQNLTEIDRVKSDCQEKHGKAILCVYFNTPACSRDNYRI